MDTTGAAIVLVIDDGAGGNLSMLPIDPAGAYGQGGSWRFNVETGRIRIFGQANSFVYGREN